MGRGISEQQKQILGVAYHANRLTQGTPRLKTGAPVANYRVPTVDYTGGKDMLWPLAAHVVRGLPFTEHRQKHRDKWGKPCGGYFDLTCGEARSVKVATIRAITALVKRDLLRLAPLGRPIRWGYVLTREGFDIGAQYEIEFDPLVYVRAGMIWYPQHTENAWFWRPFHYVEDHPAPLPDIIRDSETILEAVRRKGYERTDKRYQGVGAVPPITHSPMESTP